MSATPPVAENKELVARLFAELDKQNSGVFDELVVDEVKSEIYRSGTGVAVEDRTDLKSLWEEYWTAFPDLTTDSMTLIAEDDRVAFFKTDRGTHEGTFRGIEPTGTEIEFEYAGYFVIEDDKIVEADADGSMLSLFRQLGVELPLPE